MQDNEDESENVGGSPRQFFVNICMRCETIVGTTKIKQTSRGPEIEWFHSTKDNLQMICDGCFCFMCDSCREICNDTCIRDCEGKFTTYQFFSLT